MFVILPHYRGSSSKAHVLESLFYLLVYPQCPEQCLIGVDAKETIARQIFATGDPEPLEGAHLQTVKPRILELFLVTWKESMHGADGMDPGI